MVGIETVFVIGRYLCIVTFVFFSGTVLRLQTNLHCFFFTIRHLGLTQK